METPAKETVMTPLFHIVDPSFHGEPFEEGGGKCKYLSYFKNEHGERWVFGIDNDGRAFLTGNDVDWEVRYVGGGKKPISDWILNDSEGLWLLACWSATRFMRSDADLEVPVDVLTFPRAAMLWQLSEATLKRDASPAQGQHAKLEATKMGGVWLTTAKAMAVAYDMPDDDVRKEMIEMLIKYRKQEDRKARKRAGTRDV